MIRSQTEAVLTLLGSNVLSSRKLLDSSKLDPKLESEHEMQRERLLPPFMMKVSKLLGGLFMFMLMQCGELVIDTWGRTLLEKVAVILRNADDVSLGPVNKLIRCGKVEAG